MASDKAITVAMAEVVSAHPEGAIFSWSTRHKIAPMENANKIQIGSNRFLRVFLITEVRRKSLSWRCTVLTDFRYEYKYLAFYIFY